MIVDLNELSKLIHNRAKSKGFYNRPFNLGEKLMLIVSELGEAIEADREKKRANLIYYKEREKILTDDSLRICYENNIGGTVEDELADAIIRILDLCGYLEIDISQFIEIKMKYNLSRPSKHNKEY